MVAEPWREWLGRTGPTVVGPYPVSLAGIGYLAEAVEDERLATYVAAGGDRAPRSFVTIASRVPNWRPDSETGPDTFMLAMAVPVDCNSAVNTALEQTYLAPLMVGDRVVSQSTILAIEPRKTRLGAGFQITERIEHRTDRGVVACTENSMFRFQAPEHQPENSDGRRAAMPPLDGATPKSDFEPVLMPVTMTLLAAAAGAVRDYSRLHHDVDFARSVGHPTAFLSYSFQMAVVMRALGEWLEGDDRVHRLSLSMKAPIYLGQTVACTAVRGESGMLDITLSAGGRACTVGSANIEEAQ